MKRNEEPQILIIGGTGFLGYHFAKLCLKNKYYVVSISRKKPKKIRNLNKIKYVYVDLTNKKKLFKKINEFKDIKDILNFGREVEHKKIKETFASHYTGVKNISE